MMLVVVSVALVSCADAEFSLCDAVAGRYRSVEPGVSGLSAGPAQYDTLRIRSEVFEHQYGDIVVVGEWSCAGDQLDALDGRFKADLRVEDGALIIDRNGFAFTRSS